MLSITLLVILLASVRADYECLCSYNVEKYVYPSMNVDMKPLGSLFEFDCKAVYQSHKTKTWVAVHFAHKVGYIVPDNQTQIQTCPGQPSVEDIAPTSTTGTPTTGSNEIVTSTGEMKMSLKPKSESFTSIQPTVTSKVLSSQAGSLSRFTFPITSAALRTNPDPTSTSILIGENSSLTSLAVTKLSRVSGSTVSSVTQKGLSTIIKLSPKVLNTPGTLPTSVNVNVTFLSSSLTPSTLRQTSRNYSKTAMVPSVSESYLPPTTIFTQNIPYQSQSGPAKLQERTTKLFSLPTLTVTPSSLASTARQSASTTASSATITTRTITTSDSASTFTRTSAFASTTRRSTSFIASSKASHSHLTVPTTPYTSTERIAQCPSHLTRSENLKEFGSHCYEFILKRHREWQEAEDDCRNKGGHLVTIRNIAEQNFIYHTLRSLNFHGDKGVWIGLTDKDREGHWIWSSGEKVSFTSWAPHQPGLLYLLEDCALFDMREHGNWGDYKCKGLLLNHQDHGWICEYKKL